MLTKSNALKKIFSVSGTYSSKTINMASYTCQNRNESIWNKRIITQNTKIGSYFLRTYITKSAAAQRSKTDETCRCNRFLLSKRKELFNGLFSYLYKSTLQDLINSISRLMLYSHRIDRYSLEEQCWHFGYSLSGHHIEHNIPVHRPDETFYTKLISPS